MYSVKNKIDNDHGTIPRGGHEVHVLIFLKNVNRKMVFLPLGATNNRSYIDFLREN